MPPDEKFEICYSSICKYYKTALLKLNIKEVPFSSTLSYPEYVSKINAENVRFFEPFLKNEAKMKKTSHHGIYTDVKN